jgi:hypothetical protein
VELAPVAALTLLVAVAGPVGIVLGWWLGRRGERERVMREERRNAYVAYVRAAIRFRNASDAERIAIREERWAALAEIVLVAPPDVVRAASLHVASGDRLLEAGLSEQDRQAILIEIWERNKAFTQLARADLQVGEADPFEGMEPVVGEHIVFRPSAGADQDQ